MTASYVHWTSTRNGRKSWRAFAIAGASPRALATGGSMPRVRSGCTVGECPLKVEHSVRSRYPGGSRRAVGMAGIVGTIAKVGPDWAKLALGPVAALEIRLRYRGRRVRPTLRDG